MQSPRQQLIADTRQWIEQERAWGELLFGSADRRIGGSAQSQTQVKTANSVTSVPPSVSPTLRPSDPLTPGSKASALLSLYDEFKDCVRCPLGLTRIKFVFGVGNPEAEVMFIGEGPGFEEDRRGEPFVGKGGQLLDKMMAAIGLSRQTSAYIANIVKCHPMANPETPEARGNDRPPSPEEVATCSPILLRQIATIRPRFIVTLGSPSTKMILRTKDGITTRRGKFFPFAVDEFYPEKETLFGEIQPEARVEIDVDTRALLRETKVLPTYHPAALLRNPDLKPESWSDLKLLRDALTKGTPNGTPNRI